MNNQNEYRTDKNIEPTPADEPAAIIAPTSKTPGANSVKLPGARVGTGNFKLAKGTEKPGVTVAPTDKLVIENPVKVTDMPMHAASGDDDRMSDPQTNRPKPTLGEINMHLPSKNELIGKWKKQMGAAKVQWAKLTDNELLESEGRAEKLAGLVEERYAVASDEAARQVKAFFAKRDPT